MTTDGHGAFAEIPLTQGMVAVVDAADYPSVARFKWCVQRSAKTAKIYAVRSYRRNGKSIRVKMHRFIMNASKGVDVDHRDGDGLNNRRYNLRAATRSQNLCNRGAQSNNACGVKGVYYHKASRKWLAMIQLNGVQHYLGLHATKEQAANTYAAAARSIHGEFACFRSAEGQNASI